MPTPLFAPKHQCNIAKEVINMKESEFLKLKIPEKGDSISAEDFQYNWELIDKKLAILLGLTTEEEGGESAGAVLRRW